LVHSCRKITLAFVLTVLMMCGEVAGAAEKPVVWGTTTIIGEMLRMVGGEAIEAHTLIPPRSCPGHFDLSPGDAVRLAGARLMLRHDFQAYLDHRLTAQNPELELEVISTGGQVILPEAYLRGMKRLFDILCGRYPELADTFKANHNRAIQQVHRSAAKALEHAGRSGLKGLPVLGSMKQQGLLRWLGFEVVATFSNSPDELSVRKLAELLNSARNREIAFVAGNLQSGGEAVARTVAVQAGLPVTILSNFPGSEDHNSTYYDLLLDNVSRLARTARSERP
jgi:zinc transport system substrate-binding protein